MACKHEDFHVNAHIAFLEDTGRYYADITIKCRQCDLPFHFLTSKLGILTEEPAASVDRTELRCPIMPGEGVIPFSGEMRFEVSPKPVES